MLFPTLFSADRAANQVRVLFGIWLCRFPDGADLRYGAFASSQHPYLQPSNIGRFGMYHVVAEAAGQLKFSKKNVDQVFVFFALLAAIIIVILQLLFLLYGIAIGPFINPAHAFSWFDNPTPLNDLAFNILNDVFGINNMFCSSYFPGNCPANNPPVAPFPFHAALHELFRFYSTALLLIGTLVFLYFVFVLVLETAVTGIPFGQRFQHVWVPIRLIVAVGLLIPQNFGMNSAQYIVLYAAKYGSNMATQGWIDFNTAIAAHMHFGGGGPLTGTRPARGILLLRCLRKLMSLQSFRL